MWPQDDPPESDDRDNWRMAKDLLPVGVRIAVREAVGGWGPYTVREIHDLFNTYGFFEFTQDQSEEGGVRRGAADAFHARIDFTSPDQVRRYLDLVGEVLEHYPESDTSNSVGRVLRRRLTQAGVVRDSAGRLTLPALEQTPAEQFEDATAGIWTPDKVRLFISHTSRHRQEVGRLAAALNDIGFSCFVAHDVIEPSRDWQDVIEIALSTCDALLAVITPDFHESSWTDQEVGWALGRQVVVVPGRAGALPYGFFGAYQALNLPPIQSWSFPAPVATSVVHALAIGVYRGQRQHAPALREAMVEVITQGFCHSVSFETTRQRFPLLELIPSELWKPQQLQRLESASAANRQIKESVVNGESGPEVVRRFVSTVRKAQRASASRP